MTQELFVRIKSCLDETYSKHLLYTGEGLNAFFLLLDDVLVGELFYNEYTESNKDDIHKIIVAVMSDMFQIILMYYFDHPLTKRKI